MADTRALLGRPQHATSVGESEHGLVRGRRLARQDPERCVHRRRVDDLAGVEDALRIEGPLHADEQVVTGVAHHRADELTAKPAVAVLATERATVFFDQRRHVGGHVAEHLQTGRGVEVKQRPEVEFAGARMGVVDAVDAVFLGEQPVELGNVGGQVFDRHGRVFDDLTGLGIAGHVVDQPLPGPPQLPDLVAVAPEEHRIGVAEAGLAKLALEPLEERLEGGPVVVAKLDHQHRSRFAHHEVAVPRLLEVGLRALENRIVDQLTARGAVPHRHHRRPQSLVDGRAVHDEQSPGGGQGHQVELKLHAHEQRALGTGQQPAHGEVVVDSGIEARRPHQGIEGIAGVAASDLRPGKRVADELAGRLVTEDAANLTVDAGFEPLRSVARGRELGSRERTERHLRAVGEETTDRQQMVTGRAVGDGV